MSADFMIDPSLADLLDGPLLIAGRQQHVDRRITERHHHLRGQLLGATQGLLSVETSGCKWVVPATHAVWIPPGLPHALQSFGPFSGWSVYLAPSACKEIEASAGVISVSGLLREAVLRATGWEPVALNLAQQRIAEVIVDEISTLPREALELTLPQDQRLLKVARALVESPGEKQTLQQWARYAAIAPRTLTRRFVQETGITFTEWRQRIRLLTSLEMLAVGKPVTQVSLELGYDNISAFIALFKRTFGVTPGRYTP